MLIINPGSRIATAGEQRGWSNTYATAAARAREWFIQMTADGFDDIELIDTRTESEGRWLFEVRHKVTDVRVPLETHGIDNTAAYERQHVFAPRVYWNGSSTATPSLDDFAAEGFTKTMTYVPNSEKAGA